MHRRELQRQQELHRQRLDRIKPTIDTRTPPAPQPHLTLYGRDYAAKKRATTEAAFADLKMIQSIAKTMTRPHEIEERRGPVSLNADFRKRETYRIMSENHKLLESIENVEAFCSTKEVVKQHEEKMRFVINASHSARFYGEYDQHINKIRVQDKMKEDKQKASVEMRKEAARSRGSGKLGSSFSLPALPAASQTDSPQARGARSTGSNNGRGWGRSDGSKPSGGNSKAATGPAAVLSQRREQEEPRAKPSEQEVKPSEQATAVAEPQQPSSEQPETAPGWVDEERTCEQMIKRAEPPAEGRPPAPEAQEEPSPPAEPAAAAEPPAPAPAD